MASNKSISQQLVSPESLINQDDSGDWLRIEQPEWKDAPAGGFLAWMVEQGKELTLATVSEYYQKYNSQCEGDGSLTVEIQVRRSRVDLDYSISASFGELSEKFIHQSSVKRSETVSTASSTDIEAQLVGGVSTEWEGDVYGTGGSVVSPPPTVTEDGSVLSWGDEVSGVLRLNYTEEYDAYTLTITPREAGAYEADDPDGAYQSTVFAVWAGGAESLDIDLPDMTGFCGGGSGASIDPDDPDKDTCYDLYVTRNKCTNAIISQELRPVACPEKDGQ